MFKMRHQLPKPVKFDPENLEHRQAYVEYLKTGKWSISFEVEWPFQNRPAMVMFKLAMKACSDLIDDETTLLDNVNSFSGRDARLGPASM